MLDLIDKITNKDNIYWAWEKAKHFYKPGDVWFDEIELAGFEANLENEICSIIEDIRKSEYNLQRIKPIGFPKAGKDENGRLKTRQTFWVSVRDQVTWIAVVNIIGPFLDEKMPFWSYGNRLHISVFYERNENGANEIRFGHYRNTSKNLLRKWNQSWPMFRKHIALTIKMMTHQEIDEKEEEIQKINELINLPQLHCGYLDKAYWKAPLSTNLYWASIDFKKFYPSARIEKVKEIILEYLPKDQITDGFEKLINSLISFKIDSSGWNSEELEQSLQIHNTSDDFTNIPTGLFVSHFLSNILLLETDNTTQLKLIANRNIAHFRYVDDHIIICDSFEMLVAWILDYKDLLHNHSLGPEINNDKTEPAHLKDFLEALQNNRDLDNLENLKVLAKEESKLDPQFPSPLMTQTLTKISKINETEFDLLDEDGKERFIADIEHLLLAEFDDQEVKKDTRLSFAASFLTRLVPKILLNDDEIIDKESDLANLSYKIGNFEISKPTQKDEINNLYEQLSKLNYELSNLHGELSKKYHLLYKRTFRILQKVVYENYDKIRLWARALEFCCRTGYNGLPEIKVLISKLKSEEKASDLSVTFLESLMFQVLSNQGLLATRAILHDKITERQYRAYAAFLNALTDPDFIVKMQLSDGKFYHQKSLQLFNKTIEVIQFSILEKSEISFSDVIKNDENNSTSATFSYSAYPSSWIWLFNKSLQLNPYEPTRLWQQTMDTLSFKNPVDLPLGQLYPKYISQNAFERIVNSIKNDGWIFDLIKTNELINMQEISQLPKVGKVISKIKKEEYFSTVYDWVEWLDILDLTLHAQFFEKNQSYYDPRLSEWTSLEIVRQITDFLMKNVEETIIGQKPIPHLKHVHPNNYLIPDEWIRIENSPYSWHAWEEITRKYPIRPNQELAFIEDDRFSPSVVDPFGVEKNVDSVLWGLGSLLTCLLSRDFKLPAYWNPLGHQRAWQNLIFTKLKGAHVSSLTRQLLDSIFSKRNKETVLLDLFFGLPKYEFAEDTLIDPPIVTTLRKLHDFLVESQLILKKYRLNIQDNLPRQLIPVSLKQLSRQYQPYQDAEE